MFPTLSHPRVLCVVLLAGFASTAAHADDTWDDIDRCLDDINTCTGLMEDPDPDRAEKNRKFRESWEQDPQDPTPSGGDDPETPRGGGGERGSSSPSVSPEDSEALKRSREHESQYERDVEEARARRDRERSIHEENVMACVNDWATEPVAQTGCVAWDYKHRSDIERAYERDLERAEEARIDSYLRDIESEVPSSGESALGCSSTEICDEFGICQVVTECN